MIFLRNSFPLKAAYALVFISVFFPAAACADRMPADPDLFAAIPQNVVQIREIPAPYWFCESSDAACAYSEGDRFMPELFDLFPDVVVTRSRAAPDGSMVVRGRLEDYPMGSFILSVAGGMALIRIRIPEESREFRMVSGKDFSRFFLAEMAPSNPQALPPARPLLPDRIAAGEVDTDAPVFFQENRPKARSMMSASETEGENPYESLGTDTSLDDDEVIIRVMVVYTPAAARWGDRMGGGIENIANTSVAETQIVLDNSETLTGMKLVHTAEVGYTEFVKREFSSGKRVNDSRIDLERLQDLTDGYMDEVHDWRDQYFADLVVLLADVSDVGGISYLLRDPEGSPDYAFSLVRVRQALDNYTFVHEIGHNLGLHHHKEQNVEPGPGWLFDYSAGWRWEGEDDRGVPQWYNTVMSYNSGEYFDNGITSITLPYFSNPGVYHNGYPTGHPEDADNARTVREIREIIASYRPEPENDTLANTAKDPEEPLLRGSGGGCFIASLAP